MCVQAGRPHNERGRTREEEKVLPRKLMTSVFAPSSPLLVVGEGEGRTRVECYICKFAKVEGRPQDSEGHEVSDSHSFCIFFPSTPREGYSFTVTEGPFALGGGFDGGKEVFGERRVVPCSGRASG